MQVLAGYRDRFFILFIRIVTIGTRFLFNLLIIKDFSLEDYGTYSLFYTSITLSVILVGVDYYYYNTREILTSDRIRQQQLLGDQLIFHCLTYFVFIPFSYFILRSFIPDQYLFVFYLIFIVEHLSQEGYRVLIAYSMPILANITQFVRMAFWCVLVLVFSFSPLSILEISLETVFGFWFACALVSLVMVALVFYKKHFFRFTVNSELVSRVKAGLTVSITFFISTVLFKSIEFSSRYILDVVASKADVGIFTFYSSIASLIYVTLHSVTIVVFFPKLIQSFALSDKSLFKKLRQRFLKEIILVSLIMAAVILALAPPLLDLIGKVELKAHYHILIILLVGMVFFMLSFYAQNMLYLHRKDKQILVSSIVSAVLSVLLNVFLTIHYGITGSAVATAIGFLTLLVSKYLYSRKLPLY